MSELETTVKLKRLRVLARTLAFVFFFLDFVAVLLYVPFAMMAAKAGEDLNPFFAQGPIVFFLASVGSFIWALKLRGKIKSLELPRP